MRAWGIATADAFLGDAALRPCWTRERLLTTLGALPEGVMEFMCHPGRAPTHARTSFAVEREVELAALCDPAALATLAINGVVLTTFAAAFRNRRCWLWLGLSRPATVASSRRWIRQLESPDARNGARGVWIQERWPRPWAAIKPAPLQP